MLYYIVLFFCGSLFSSHERDMDSGQPWGVFRWIMGKMWSKHISTGKLKPFSLKVIHQLHFSETKLKFSPLSLPAVISVKQQDPWSSKKFLGWHFSFARWHRADSKSLTTSVCLYWIAPTVYCTYIYILTFLPVLHQALRLLARRVIQQEWKSVSFPILWKKLYSVQCPSQAHSLKFEDTLLDTGGRVVYLVTNHIGLYCVAILIRS